MTTRYVDQIGQYQPAVGGTVLNSIDYRSTGHRILYWDGTNEIAHFVFQLNHNKALGEPIKSLHMHFIPLEAVSGTMVFNINYHWNAGYLSEVPASTGWTSTSATFVATSAHQYKHCIVNLATNIPAPSAEGYSSMFMVTINRIGSGLDDYGTAGILYVDIHYPTDRQGSIFEYSDIPPGTIS